LACKSGSSFGTAGFAKVPNSPNALAAATSRLSSSRYARRIEALNGRSSQMARGSGDGVAHWDFVLLALTNRNSFPVCSRRWKRIRCCPWS
jgi:hypothetical protein